MKKAIALLLALGMLLSCAAFAEGGAFTPGTYEGTGAGFAGPDSVHVTLTVDETGITSALIEGDAEVPFGAAAFETYQESLVGRSDAQIDAVAGATMTHDGVVEAVGQALAAAAGAGAEEVVSNSDLTYAAGVYEGVSEGFNGPVTVSVTYGDTVLEAIEVVSSMETDHIGTLAFDIMIPEMLQANGCGVDSVSGATSTSRALRAAVESTAQQAGCSDMDAFRSNTVRHTASDPLEIQYDVVVVGGGGAGMAAAAQAAQDGNTVLVIEKNADVGGNTLISGGRFQSTMPYLVWDPANPDATTGVYARKNETFDKVKSARGCINELKIILNWSEEPFDEAYYQENEFVPGDIRELSQHGVHEEYLPVLQTLKSEIQAYLDWAQPQLDAGTPENQLTLFSTLNLHIFQTYYGGLRQSADKSEWVYGDVELVSQIVQGGQGLKEWLEDQGATFVEDAQSRQAGAMWYRENEPDGSTVDLDGDGEPETGSWGCYFAAPMSTLYAANQKNAILIRTTATDLILEGGRVVGVSASFCDGTPIIARASKGVILATGGYAANADMVAERNAYWPDACLSAGTGTTNRSSQVGDGIRMAEAVGAQTTGLGFAQLMPIAWADGGGYAYGSGSYACWINPTTGRRFVDEGSDREALSKAAFANGMEIDGTKGVFLEFYNSEQALPAPQQLAEGDREGRYYRRTIAELPELFAQLGIPADPNTVIETLRAYDQAVMGKGEYPDVGKASASRTIGGMQRNEDGRYDASTYDLDSAVLTIRLLAPSAHYTMGGVCVDLDRHVINTDNSIIPGLYAAGEVTGGIHGGNRLNGNSILEALVSGRVAARTAAADSR